MHTGVLKGQLDGFIFFFVEPESEEMQWFGLGKAEIALLYDIFNVFHYILLSFTQWASKQETKDESFDVFASGVR